MKTRQEILEHLVTTEYTALSVAKIMGFLIGKDIKTPDEEFYVIINDEAGHTFSHFFAWFNDEDFCDDSCGDCALCSIINDIATRLERAETEEDKELYAKQLHFMLEAFSLDEVDEE